MIIINFIFFLISIIIIISISYFLFKGPTIFDLIINSKISNIYTKIVNDIEDSIEKSNEEIKYNIAINNNFMYITNNEDIIFNPVSNSITILTKNKERKTLDMVLDDDKIVPLLAKLNKNIEFKYFTI